MPATFQFFPGMGLGPNDGRLADVVSPLTQSTDIAMT